jgi:signal transduction histidine kinase
MSHEFRTPLNSIIGFTDLLAEQGEGPLGESYADYVHHVQEGAHHLLALVNDVLDLSRIEAGRIDLRHEEFAAADAISEVLSVTGPLAEAKNIELRSDVPPTLLAYGDRTRFKQILYNLPSNAVKFTPAAGKVQVTAETDYGEIRFSVSDTGIGIPPEQQTAIFEEFTQVAPATRGVKEGAGLGLTITKRFMAGAFGLRVHRGRGAGSCSPCQPSVAPCAG